MPEPAPAPFAVLVPGSVLLDHYADTGEKFLGGAEFNFAHHLHHLLGGVDFAARIGRDEAGAYIQEELRRRDFPAGLLQTDPSKPTKTVLVRNAGSGGPTFLIPDDVASEFLEFPPLAPERLKAYDLVYFGTTLQHGAASRATLRALLDQCSGLKFCDLNLRPPKYTGEIVRWSLQACDALKINQEELDALTEMFGLLGTREEKLRVLSEEFYIPEICLTLGPRGSLYFRRGHFDLHKAPPVKVVDTVGAGDAFSAGLAVGMLEDWEPQRTLDFASELAGAVCAFRGAVPERPDFYAGLKGRL